MHRTWPSENGVNNPHNYPTDQQRQSHYPKIFQILADDFRKRPRWDCSHDKCNEREGQWMRKNGAISEFTLGKRTNKLYNPTPKINRQRQNGSELDHDCIHLPEAVLQIDVQQSFADAQMRGRTHREKFGQSFD